MKNDQLNNELFALAESLLDDNHSLNYRLKGNSMYPVLKAGDIARVDACHLNSLKKGDIVVFKANDILIGHRIVDIKNVNNNFILTTRGDNSPHNDALFPPDELLGKITSFKRNNRERKVNSPCMNFRKFTAMNFPRLLLKTNKLALALRNRFNKLKSVKHNLSVITENSGKILLSNAIISILQGILPFAVIVFIKALIDALTHTETMNSGQQKEFITLLIVTALVFLFNAILNEIKSYTSERLSQSVIKNIYQKLHSKHSKLDLSHYENPEEQNKIHRAVQESSYRPLKIINELLLGLKSIASALFLVGIFIAIKWYLVAILFVAIIPDVLVRMRFSQKLYKLKTKQSADEREMYYYNRVLTGFPFAKEQKLFGFSDFFLFRFTAIQKHLFGDKLSLRKSELKFEIFAQTFAILLIFFALAYVSFMKINGFISIGTVVLFFFAFQRGYSVLNDLFRSFTQIIEDNTFLNDFIDFLNIPSKSKNQQEAKQPFLLQKEISIEHVNFRYETSKRDALSDINIIIPAGKTVAFVGANGSGKTTLIKLLCGFYKPHSGHILFDGVDANSIGEQKVRDNISAVFQDFALYNITALKNIGLGNSKADLDLQKAKKAAEAAGVAEVLENLPNGYNTLLGNLFTDGEELSIGQWQKIAIARAFYRDAPLLLMDEPSSALDAQSELQIIQSLKNLSRNKTAVIISHRLSTVQWADLIYVFDEGKIVESGTHRDLLSLHGKYFNLFQTYNEHIE